MKAFTDYPIIELGDIVGQQAPIRSCVVVGYDGDKMCKIVVGGIEKEIKSGYIYKKAGRLGFTPCIDVKEINKF